MRKGNCGIAVIIYLAAITVDDSQQRIIPMSTSRRGCVQCEEERARRIVAEAETAKIKVRGLLMCSACDLLYFTV